MIVVRCCCLHEVDQSSTCRARQIQHVFQFTRSAQEFENAVSFSIKEEGIQRKGKFSKSHTDIFFDPKDDVICDFAIKRESHLKVRWNF